MSVDSNDPLEKFQRNLPHWNYPDSVYFVTWRLHKNQATLHELERDLIDSTLKYFDLARYRLYSFVIMDDHIHVLFRPFPNNGLTKILHTWKSFSANQMQRRFGREGSIWQEESYDRIVRNEVEFYNEARYILNNPYKRWRVEKYKWLFWRHPENEPSP